MRATELYFGELYRQDDPYGYRDRWYEQRKRQLLLACLPQRRFGAAWEIGCSNGELAAVLAPRCDTLLATDLSERAVQLAGARTAALGNVTVRQAAHPQDWPPEKFELIVFSEVGYFLTSAALGECIERMRGSLTPQGLLVACHWQHPFEEACLPGSEVHRMLHASIGLPRLFRYRDADMLLEGWSAACESVAEREGLV